MLRRAPNLLKYRVKNVSNGWFTIKRDFDVGTITDVTIRERLFTFTDENKPYLLQISYHMPKNVSGLTLAYSPRGGLGIAGDTYYDDENIEGATFRGNLNEVEQEFNEISRMQEKLDKYLRKREEDIKAMETPVK